MENNKKSGKSLIFLIIVICIMSFIILFIVNIFNNSMEDSATEEAFKLNVYEYYLEIEEYKSQINKNVDFNIEELDVCGVDMKKIIPNIKEKDLSKFIIEDGELVYIGIDENEAKWTNEVKI